MQPTTNVEKIAQRIGIPATQWAGRCHEIAGKILQAKLASGKLRYGHWTGPIHPESLFAGRPFTHHGWIEDSGSIVDPTRWAFEYKLPYIYVGESDHYDAGGNRISEMFRQPCPKPTEGRNLTKKRLNISPEAEQHLVILSGYNPPWTPWQLLWIGSAPLHHLGNFAAEIVTALIKGGHGAAIPQDNREIVLG